MGRILKQGDMYFVEFFGNGLRFQKKAGPTQEEAELKLKAIEAALDESSLDVNLATVRVEEFVVRYKQFGKNVYTPLTLNRYIRALEHFVLFLKNRLSTPALMKDITPRVMEDYKAYLMDLAAQWKRKPQLINFTLFLVRDILEHARTLRFLNDNPTQHLKYLKEGFSPALPTVENESGDFLYSFVLKTGLTFDECIRLKWEDIDLNQGMVSVTRTLSETKKTRRIPLEPDFIQQCRDQKETQEEYVFPGVSFDAIPFIALRHTFAKNLLKRGVKLMQLNRFLGFDDVAKVYRYAAFLPEAE